MQARLNNYIKKKIVGDKHAKEHVVMPMVTASISLNICKKLFGAFIYILYSFT
jgi:hypothetical protein